MAVNKLSVLETARKATQTRIQFAEVRVGAASKAVNDARHKKVNDTHRAKLEQSFSEAWQDREELFEKLKYIRGWIEAEKEGAKIYGTSGHHKSLEDGLSDSRQQA